MKRMTALVALVGYGALVTTPALAQAPSGNCPAAKGNTGKSYSFTPLPPANQQAMEVAKGYHLKVRLSVAGQAGEGESWPVLLDTGSNVLVVPYYVVPGFPANPDQALGKGVVISGKQPYSYGSSGIGYQGYMVLADVHLSGADPKGTNATAGKVQVYAVTEYCNPHKKPAPAGGHQVETGNGSVEGPGPTPPPACQPVSKDSHIGMMGVGFRPATFLKVLSKPTDPSSPLESVTNTNVFGALPGVTNQGWVFGKDKVTVGLNEQAIQGFTWTGMTQGPKGFEPQGCYEVTNGTSGTPTPKQCGFMLVDTGMAALNIWSPGGLDCPSKTDKRTGAGFQGEPLAAGAKVALTFGNTSAGYIMNIGSKDPGTPVGAFCTPTPATDPQTGKPTTPAMNVGRMPLEVFSVARSETCQSFGFQKLAGK